MMYWIIVQDEQEVAAALHVPLFVRFRVIDENMSSDAAVRCTSLKPESIYHDQHSNEAELIGTSDVAFKFNTVDHDREI